MIHTRTPSTPTEPRTIDDYKAIVRKQQQHYEDAFSRLYALMMRAGELHWGAVVRSIQDQYGLMPATKVNARPLDRVAAVDALLDVFKRFPDRWFTPVELTQMVEGVGFLPDYIRVDAVNDLRRERLVEFTGNGASIKYRATKRLPAAG